MTINGEDPWGAEHVDLETCYEMCANEPTCKTFDYDGVNGRCYRATKDHTEVGALY